MISLLTTPLEIIIDPCSQFELLLLQSLVLHLHHKLTKLPSSPLKQVLFWGKWMRECLTITRVTISILSVIDSDRGGNLSRRNFCPFNIGGVIC